MLCYNYFSFWLYFCLFIRSICNEFSLFFINLYKDVLFGFCDETLKKVYLFTLYFYLNFICTSVKICAKHLLFIVFLNVWRMCSFWLVVLAISFFFRFSSVFLVINNCNSCLLYYYKINNIFDLFDIFNFCNLLSLGTSHVSF